jgi:hypothetical protein
MADTKICQIMDYISRLLSAIPGALFVNDSSRVTNEENGNLIILEWAEERGFVREEPDMCRAVDVLPVRITIQCPRQISQAPPTIPVWKILSPWNLAVHTAMYADRTLGGLASVRLGGIGSGGVLYRGQQPSVLPTVVRLDCLYDISFSTSQNDLSQ